MQLRRAGFRLVNALKLTIQDNSQGGFQTCPVTRSPRIFTVFRRNFGSICFCSGTFWQEMRGAEQAASVGNPVTAHLIRRHGGSALAAAGHATRELHALAV